MTRRQDESQIYTNKDKNEIQKRKRRANNNNDG